MVWLVFWLSLAALVYVYAGYSLVLVLVGLLRNRRVRQRPCTPRISLIIAAHNEARAIARRLEKDRKSTRLNSSHSQISYAVFCLKKKKNPARTTSQHPTTLQRHPLQFLRLSPQSPPRSISRHPQCRCARHTRIISALYCTPREMP